MTSRLVLRVEDALRRVRQSGGYRDTAEQIVAAMAPLIDVDAIERIAQLERELAAEKWSNMALRSQWLSREVRQKQKLFDLEDFTRVCVVNYRSDRGDAPARQLDISGSEIKVAVQDEGRTLKVFVYEQEPCPHDSLSGAEGPIAVLGRMPEWWRCDECGVILKDGEPDANN